MEKRRRDRDRHFARLTRWHDFYRRVGVIAIGASRDWRGAGDVAISSFSLSLSLSLSSIFQGWKSFEVKMETEMIFCCFGSHIWSTRNDFRSTGNAFQFDRI